MNVINFHTSNLFLHLYICWEVCHFALTKQLGIEARERQVPNLRCGDPAEIAIIRITLLGFLLHFLFDLLRSPEGSRVGTEDSAMRARPADVVAQEPECNVPINLELNVAET